MDGGAVEWRFAVGDSAEFHRRKPVFPAS